MTTTTTTPPLPAEALISIPERHVCALSFNVMPDRTVEERLLVREYRVGERYAEAHFDREYRSAMRNSPSHLIFLTALVHTQKLLYAALCREFDLNYEPEGPELFKMWPTKVEVRIPERIDAEQDLVQQLWITDLKRFDASTYRATIETRVGSLFIRATIPTFVI